MLEKHPFFSQTFIPKGNTPFIIVVSPPSEEPLIANILRPLLAMEIKE